MIREEYKHNVFSVAVHRSTAVLFYSIYYLFSKYYNMAVDPSKSDEEEKVKIFKEKKSLLLASRESRYNTFRKNLFVTNIPPASIYLSTFFRRVLYVIMFQYWNYKFLYTTIHCSYIT